MATAKETVYNELYGLLADDSECPSDVDQIIKYLCDYFSTTELAGLIEHIKEEKGIEIDNDNDDE